VESAADILTAIGAQWQRAQEMSDVADADADEAGAQTLAELRKGLAGLLAALSADDDAR